MIFDIDILTYLDLIIEMLRLKLKFNHPRNHFLSVKWYN